MVSFPPKWTYGICRNQKKETIITGDYELLALSGQAEIGEAGEGRRPQKLGSSRDSGKSAPDFKEKGGGVGKGVGCQGHMA
jgi:hypothetical protein